MKRIRLLPQRSFPAYAYLPGQQPHPVRDPGGHSYQLQSMQVTASLASDEFVWGNELFNHGYYWEAHEAWEVLWHVAEKGSQIRALLKALIFLSAAGVKIREGKPIPAMRHAGRAALLLHQLACVPHEAIFNALGISLIELATQGEKAARAPFTSRVLELGRPESVFDFVVGHRVLLSSLNDANLCT